MKLGKTWLFTMKGRESFSASGSGSVQAEKLLLNVEKQERAAARTACGQGTSEEHFAT